MDLEKTRDDLINEVAYTKLRIAGTGQPLEPEYEDEIDRKIDPLFAQLSVDQVCHIGNSDAIPSEWFENVASLLANICAPMKGKPFDPSLKIFHELALKRLTSTRTTFEITQADYF
jgi:hypothetical protein